MIKRNKFKTSNKTLIHNSFALHPISSLSLWDKWDKTGKRKHERGNRRQETGDRKQEAGNRTGNKRQETDRKQEGRDSRQETQNSQCGGPAQAALAEVAGWGWGQCWGRSTQRPLCQCSAGSAPPQPPNRTSVNTTPVNTAATSAFFLSDSHLLPRSKLPWKVWVTSQTSSLLGLEQSQCWNAVMYILTVCWMLMLIWCRYIYANRMYLIVRS